jgi:hypothetical protein
LHVDPAVLPTTLVQPRLTGGQLQVSLPSQLGLRYTLQFKNTLIAPAWQNLGTASGNGQTIILTDPQILPSRFYRVLVEEDPSQ